MIKDKRRSLDRAVLYSYQAAEIVKVNADMNSDNVLDSSDLVHLRKLILGIYK